MSKIVKTYSVHENDSTLTPLVVRYSRKNNILYEVEVSKMYSDTYDKTISYGRKEEVLEELESLIKSLNIVKEEITTTE